MSATNFAKRRIRVRDDRKGSPTKGDYIWIDVNLSLDLETIAQYLGRKAMTNKSRKSKLNIGIVAEVTGEGNW